MRSCKPPAPRAAAESVSQSVPLCSTATPRFKRQSPRTLDYPRQVCAIDTPETRANTTLKGQDCTNTPYIQYGGRQVGTVGIQVCIDDGLVLDDPNWGKPSKPQFVSGTHPSFLAHLSLGKTSEMWQPVKLVSICQTDEIYDGENWRQVRDASIRGTNRLHNSL